MGSYPDGQGFYRIYSTKIRNVYVYICNVKTTKSIVCPVVLLNSTCTNFCKRDITDRPIGPTEEKLEIAISQGSLSHSRTRLIVTATPHFNYPRP